MKNLSLVFCFACAMVLMGSCSSSPAGNPRDTLSAFFDAMSKKDMETVRKLTTSESKGIIDMMQMGMNMVNDNSALANYDKANMEIGEAVINGDEATVITKEKTTGES